MSIPLRAASCALALTLTLALVPGTAGAAAIRPRVRA